MKKLLTVLVLLLAINFLAVLGGVGYLAGTGALSPDKLAKVGDVLYPPASQPSTQASTQPSEEGLSPMARLEELLSKQAGRTATEQVQFIRAAFDERAAQVERRLSEMQALQRQVESARQQLERDRSALDARAQALAARESETARREADEGFQSELKLYQSLPSDQVKKLFMAMDDELVARYLQAMQPRQASKIIKEFETPDELAKVGAVLEKIRKATGDPSPTPAQAPGQSPGQNSSQAPS